MRYAFGLVLLAAFWVFVIAVISPSALAPMLGGRLLRGRLLVIAVISLGVLIVVAALADPMLRRALGLGILTGPR